MIISDGLLDFFSAQVETLPDCQAATKSYVLSVLAQPRMDSFDLSGQSITLEFATAKFEPSFAKFQRLGDWLLVAQSIFPTSLQSASFEYYSTIAQISYSWCYRLLNQAWPIFAELAELFPLIVKNLRRNFRAYQEGKLLIPEASTIFGGGQSWGQA